MKKFLSLIFSVVIISFFALDIYAAESVPKKVLEQTDSVVRIISEYKDGDIVDISAGVEHPKVTVLHGNVEDILEDYTFYNEEKKFSSLYLKVYTKDKNIVDVLYRRFYPPAYWKDSQ